MEHEGLDRLSREELLELLAQQAEVIGRQQTELAAAGEDAGDLVGATVAGPEGEPGRGVASEAGAEARAPRR